MANTSTCTGFGRIGMRFGQVVSATLAAIALNGYGHAADVPGIMAYQGRIAVDGAAFTGTGYFKFALVDSSGGTTYWSNDGSGSAGSEPAAAVTISVQGGLFALLLGDIGLANMTAIPASVYDNDSVWLRIWFSDTGAAGSFELLTPDRRMAVAGYAFAAQNSRELDGQTGSFYRDAGNLNAGTIAAARLPAATTSALGAVRPDGTTIVVDANGIISTTVASGLGSIASQDAASVSISGGAIDGTTIGGSTPAAVTGTAITATGDLVAQGADLTLGVGTTADTGAITLHDGDAADSNTATIEAPADLAASVTLTLPSSSGTLALAGDTQASDPFLSSIATLGTAADRLIYTTGVNAAAETPLSAFARSLIDDGDAITAAATLGLSIGSQVQAFDADLTTIAGLIEADNTFIVGTGSGWAAESAASARGSLGLGSIATQAATSVSITGGAIDGTTIGGSTPAAVTGTTITATGDLVAQGADLTLGVGTTADTAAITLHDGDAADSNTATIEAPADLAASVTLTLPSSTGTLALAGDTQTSDAFLTSIAALGTTADRLIYTTGADTAAEATLTSFARTLLDDADAATMRATLGLGVDSDVQGYDAFLASLAALGTTADRLIYTTGADTAAEATLTSFARTLLDDGNATTMRATLGLSIGSQVQAYDADLTTIAGLTEADNTFIVGTGSGWAAESAATTRGSLGLGSIATQAATNVSITGGAIDGTTIGGSTPAAVTGTAITATGDLVAQGADLTLGVGTTADTGAITLHDGDAADSNTATIDAPADLAASVTLTLPSSSGTLALAGDTQTSDAFLTSIAALGTTADRLIYTTGADTAAEATLTSFARTLLDDGNATTMRATLGVSIGSQVQAYDADLTTIAGLTEADNTFIVGTGSGWAAESAATARGSLGLGSAATSAASDFIAVTGDTMTGALVVSNATASTSSTTGAITITGGLGVGGAVHLGGDLHRSTTAGITASVTQTQGEGALTADINQIATVGTDNDTVTLPAAVAGKRITIINDGANTLQVFPASGDAINGGSVNAATTIAAGVNVIFTSHDGTNWTSRSSASGLAGAIADTQVAFGTGGAITSNANLTYAAGTGLTIADTTASTDETTGALVVGGGLGVRTQSYIGDTSGSNEGGLVISRSGTGGTLFRAERSGAGGHVFEAANYSGNLARWLVSGQGAQVSMAAWDSSAVGASSYSNGSGLYNANGLGLYFDDTSSAMELVGGTVAITDSTVSTSPSTGAVTVSGGLGVSGNVHFGGDLHLNTTAGITASTTQSQGQGALTADINQIATVGTDSDTVTLPAAVAGKRITVINNGANTLQVFPASGDAIDGGSVDTATTIAAGITTVFTSYDGTNWTSASNASGLAGSIADTQVGYGSSTSLTGSANFLYDGSELQLTNATNAQNVVVQVLQNDASRFIDIVSPPNSSNDGGIYLANGVNGGKFRSYLNGQSPNPSDSATYTEVFRLDSGNNIIFGAVQGSASATGNEALEFRVTNTVTDKVTIGGTDNTFDVGADLDVVVNSSTASSSTSTGAVVVTGGIGVGDDLYIGDQLRGRNGIGAAAAFGNAVGTLDPFGSMASDPTTSSTTLRVGDSSSSSGANRAAGWFYSNHGDSNDLPRAVYGTIALGRNNGTNSTSDLNAYGLWAEGRGQANGSSGSNIAYGIYARASGADTNYAGYFVGAVETTGDSTIGGLLHRSVTAGITASTTQSQGQGPLTTEVNQITTVGTTDDTVTLPAAVAGERITVINDGANRLQVFPASGDAIDSGSVDAAVTIAAGVTTVFTSYDTTNWVSDSNQASVTGSIADTQVGFGSGSALAGSANFTYTSGTGLAIGDTTTASDTTSGALTVAGGLGVDKRSRLRGLTVTGDTLQANNRALIYSNLSGGNVEALYTAGQVTGSGGSGVGHSLRNGPSFQNMTGDYTATPISLSGNTVSWATTVNFNNTVSVAGVADFYSRPTFSNALGGGTLSVDNHYGYYYETSDALATGFSIANSYGIYLEEPTRGSTINRSIHVAGGETYLGGVTTLGASLSLPIRSVSSATTASSTDYTIIAAAGSAYSVTLPASPSSGQVLVIRTSGSTSTNNITIDRNGNNIDGSAANLVLSVDDEYRVLQFDGAGSWWVIGR